MTCVPRLHAIRTIIAIAFVTGLATSAAAQTASPSVEPVIVGANVNMVGGPAIFSPPSTLTGDPFLQRQNEPSLAVSSRNPCHLLAGANDYRAVDLEEAVGEVGDAWLGVFKSFDCGSTWTSTLLPGHPVDDSIDGLQSPLRGLQAAADATVRSGTNGMFYYSGIAFNRGEGGIGKVFVARFLDNNNKDGGDPIQYLGTAQIDLGTSGQFLDKPWIVADIPRGGGTCLINGRTVPAGFVYLVYTSFVGDGTNVRSKIMFSRSIDCGVTWSNPAKLSERYAKNQGTTIAIDPGTGALHIAWREFSTPSDSKSQNSILVASSTDGGRSFSKAVRLAPNNYQFLPFDQASSPLTFRTNAYPTIAVVPAEADGRAAGQPGRVYLAWAARGFVPLRAGQSEGDARIVVSTSVGGQIWSSPTVADNYPGAGHQIMPTMAFAGGKVALAWYDLREDRSLGFDDLAIEYGQASFNACMTSHGGIGFAAVLACITDTANTLSLTRRHTLDLRSAMADSACLGTGACALTSYSVLGGGSRRVSRYIEGFVSAEQGRQQLQYNRPNLPLFSKGRFPFIGDYIDIAGLTFVATADGGWAWNTGRGANRPAPVFHVSWADNRNVGTPKNTNWEQFTPAVLGPNFVQCVPGQVGIRNQDVYTAQLKPQLSVSAPLNSKRVVGLQRSFVVVVQNATDSERDYLLTLQPPVGVVASFNQFLGFDGNSSALGTIEVRIPRKSSVSRTVFVGLATALADPTAAPDILVPVHVAEVQPGSGGVPTGVSDVVFLNPDFENPDFENPDFENAELHNPDFENPDFENPDFENPDFENFTLSAASPIRNPDFENPDFENPDFENPDFENPDFENPDFENPDFENPDFENPDFENPDFENPDFENPDFENGAFEVADTTFPVRNDGNTTSAYKANVYVDNPPEGVRYQLVVRRVFYSPASVCALPTSASPVYAAQNQALVNIVAPQVQASLFDRNFNDPSRQNATFYLAPGERASITLRAYCEVGATGCDRPAMATFEGRTALSVVAQGANCVTCVGLGCSLTDAVAGTTECLIDEGPPKDVYDPIPPTVALFEPTSSPSATDLNHDGTEPVAFTLSASDNISVVSVTCTSSIGELVGVSGGDGQYAFAAAFPVGTTTVACTASDPRPNSASVSFDVIVYEVPAPTFGDPPFIFTSQPTGANGWYTTPQVTATVNATSTAAFTVSCSDSLNATSVSGDTITISGDGIHEIECSAASTASASASATAVVKIDHTAPVITSTGPQYFEATSANGALVNYTVATATDGVSATTVSCAPPNGTQFPLGSTAIACTATDEAGNSASASFAVVVRDTTAPVLTLPADITGVPMTSAAGAVVNYVATATDVVSGTVVPVCAPGSGAIFPAGPTVVTCTATDGAGNVATGAFSVTVLDLVPPSSITVTGVNPPLLWPPDGRTVNVVVSGTAFDGQSGTAKIEWRVIDEYGTHQPSGFVAVSGNGPFEATVPLIADRKGNDRDGRHYTIVLTAVDRAGNRTELPLAQSPVVNVHDQSTP